MTTQLTAQDIPVPVIDGRTARSVRTRSLVVEALLSLLAEGDLSPTAQRVASRAGVAARTLFVHFSDMEDLFAEAGRRELDKLLAMVEVIDPDLALAERLDRFCDTRGRVLEALLPVMRAARLRAHASPELQASWALYVAVSDQELGDVFATEMAPLGPAARAALLDTLYLTVGTAGWEALRFHRGLSIEQATDRMRHTVGCLLADGQPRR